MESIGDTSVLYFSFPAITIRLQTQSRDKGGYHAYKRKEVQFSASHINAGLNLWFIPNNSNSCKRRRKAQKSHPSKLGSKAISEPWVALRDSASVSMGEEQWREIPNIELAFHLHVNTWAYPYAHGNKHVPIHEK